MGCYHPHVFRVDEDYSAEDRIRIALIEMTYRIALLI